MPGAVEHGPGRSPVAGTEAAQVGVASGLSPQGNGQWQSVDFLRSGLLQKPVAQGGEDV